MAIVVNVFGGPGIGKSVLSADLFARLKRKGIHCENIQEYAKDKVWEDSFHTLDNQLYVFGKQYHRIFRVLDKVEVVVTDAPLLNNILYNNFHGDQKECFTNLIKSITHDPKMKNFNILLERDVPYEEIGRMQDLEDAKKLDAICKDILDNDIEDYITFNPNGDIDALVDQIISLI
jgi:nicotinamide riboside kinase